VLPTKDGEPKRKKAKRRKVVLEENAEGHWEVVEMD
jgi:hypothetical protein